MHAKTITELRKLLDTRQVSSRELTEHFLKRIATHNSDLNAFITVNEEKALAQAVAADASLGQGKAGPLTGIPIAQKDIFCTKGIKTTCGSKMLANFVAPYDATTVTKLNQAGTVMLGKTNMDEFAMGSSNENSAFGPVKNPWGDNHVPGGSSGGSAAAVAAGLCVAATGTDTGGSIRQPASLCGITGLKPTYSRISRYGMIAFASSLDQGGPMTRSAEDAALMLAAMAGLDPLDATSANQPVPDYTKHLNDSLKGVKIGLPKEYFAEGLDGQIEKALQEAIHQYKSLGAEIHEISLPNTALALPAYYIIAPAECSSNLARFDGVRYGHRCKNPENLLDLYERSRSEGFGEEVKARIMVGTYALSAGYYDAYYRKAQQIRRIIRDDFQNAFKKVDIILGPTTPGVAFKIGDKCDDPISMYLSDIYTVGISLAGLPAMSIPCGFVNHLPVGMQLVSNYFTESKLLNVAHQYQQNTDWHQRQPERFF